MNKVFYLGFGNELEKIAIEKKAVDPFTTVALGAAGKIMLQNLLVRHGMNIPGVRRVIAGVGREAMGFGARAGAAGKPIIPRPIRELAALTIDPHLVKAYERAHAVGKAVGPGGLDAAKELAARAGKALNKQSPVAGEMAGPYLKMMSEVPTKATGARRALDVLHAPFAEAKAAIKKRIAQPSRKKLMQSIYETGLPPPEIIM